MRNTITKTIAATLAAVALSLAVSASPASAGGWHGGWHHHGGFWGPGVAFGVFGLAAGAIAASQYECVRYRPAYDGYGNYIGQQAVNIC
jgi:hypothetical protein